MANTATVGTAVIKLSFDGKNVKAELDGVSKNLESAGKSSGKKFGDAWTIAAGNLIAKGISKAANFISNSLDKAISRVDTLNNYPKVMTALGYSTEEAASSIEKMSDRLLGLPTSLDQSVSDVQKLAATMGNLNQGMVNATSVGLALNDMFLAGGKGQEAASRAMEQYNQMLAAGKPDMQSWRSMLDAAPGQLKQLAQTLLGASASQMDLYNALQDGTVTFDQMNEAIVRLDQEGGEGFAGFEEQARSATGGIGTALENMQSRMAMAIGKVIEALNSERIAGAINSISSSFAVIADFVVNIINWVVDNWSLISPILTGITTFFAGLLAMNIGTKIITFLSTTASMMMAPHILAIISAIAMGAMLIMQNWEPISEFFSNVFGPIGEFIGNTWNGIVEGAQRVWDFITGIFSGLTEFFGSIFSGAWERVKAVFSTGGQIFMGIVDGITNAFRTIVNAIITGINHVVALPFNAINGFLSFLKGIDILGIQPFSWVGTIDVPQIPLLAQGGVAMNATTAVIGEAGKEAVLPLENNTDNWAGLLASTLVDEMEMESVGGREIVVNMTNEISNTLDAEEIGRVMMQSIRRAA